MSNALIFLGSIRGAARWLCTKIVGLVLILGCWSDSFSKRGLDW